MYRGIARPTLSIAVREPRVSVPFARLFPTAARASTTVASPSASNIAMTATPEKPVEKFRKVR